MKWPRRCRLRDEQENPAHSEATRRVSKAKEDAHRMENEAKTSANAKLNQARIARDNFLAWHKARTEFAPRGMASSSRTTSRKWRTVTIRLAAFKDYGSAEPIAGGPARPDRFSPVLGSHTGVLRGRDKIIIDADKLPGRRHLFLIDPDLIRPAMLMQGTPKTRGRRSGFPGHEKNCAYWSIPV